MNQITEQDSRQQWQEHRAELDADMEPGWEEHFQPGSFGCHELLDRVNMIGDLVEAQVLNHPACVLDEEWHHLASQATELLRELYQRVGSKHVGAE